MLVWSIVALAAPVVEYLNVTESRTLDTCTSRSNSQCYGDDISDAGYVSSAGQCCDACKRTTGCMAWTWNEGVDKHCWVKTGCSDQRSDSRYSSGTISAPPSPSGKGLCGGGDIVELSSESVWDANGDGASRNPSCQSPLEDKSAVKQCAGDPTSVVIQTMHTPLCASASSSGCRFSMHDLIQLDATLDMRSCKGTWSAPLWLTPDYWHDGPISGEIDMIEQCPMDKLCANFAGGGERLCFDEYDPDEAHMHVTLRKADGGKITVAYCSGESDECSDARAAVYENIFSSNACSTPVVGDCMFQMFSDIWLGTKGDGGWASCSHSGYKADSKCEFSVRDIRIQTKKPFDGACAALNA